MKAKNHSPWEDREVQPNSWKRRSSKDSPSGNSKNLPFDFEPEGTSNLSEKIREWKCDCPSIHAFDVKEFIKRLKEKAKEHDDMKGEVLDYFNPDCNQSFTRIIDKLAGEELSK